MCLYYQKTIHLDYISTLKSYFNRKIETTVVGQNGKEKLFFSAVSGLYKSLFPASLF
jgi:hypothetical protein